MNKKLFKGALVLFASILMAVSCSNNPANPEDPNKPNGPGTSTKQDVAVSLKTGSKLGAAGTTDSKVEIANANTAMDGSAKTVDVELEGNDIGDISTDGNKIVVSVNSIEGVLKAEFNNNSAASATKTDITATIAKNTVTPAVAAAGAGKKVTLTFTDNFGAAVGASGQIDADSKIGMVKIILKFEDKTETKNTITIPVYVLVGKKAG